MHFAQLSAKVISRNYCTVLFIMFISYLINLILQAAEMDRTKFRGVNLGGTMGPLDLERGGGTGY